MSSILNIALIGCGRIGQVHARNLLGLRQVCSLKTIADTRQDTLEEIGKLARFDKLTTDIDEVFDDRSIDAVIIASSTSTHAEYIVKAASTGKHIFVEKPIALDLENTDLATAAAQKANVQLQVGFQRRFDTGYMAARTSILEGALGNLTMIRDAMRDPEPPPADYLPISGGLFRDMSIHNFDCVRWLMGSDPVELFAMGSALVSEDAFRTGDIDTSVVVLKFPSGALATIENSRKSGFGYDVRTEVFGDISAVIVGESIRTPIRHFDRTGTHQDHQYFFLDRFHDAYCEELASFLDHVRTDSEVEVTGADGRAALALAIAAETSLGTGLPVQLDAQLAPIPATRTHEQRRTHA